MSEDQEYNLKESVKGLGKLVPILKDANGNIIDGIHRLEIDSNWPSITLENVKDRKQLTIARLAVNVCRRKVSSQEKTMLLGEIAELTGWNSQEIANALGMSQNWVLKYLPEQSKNKEKAEAGQKGAEALATRRVAESQVSAEPVQQTVKTYDGYSLPTCPIAIKPAPSTPAEMSDEESQAEQGAMPTLADVSKVSESAKPRTKVEPQACPCCGSLLDPEDYEETKLEVGIKYGSVVQSKLFPNTEACVEEA